MSTEEFYEEIEKYLDGTLKGEKKADFEERMKNDNKLRAEVELHKDLSTFLADSPEKAFQDNLKKLGDNLSETPPPNKGGWLKFLLPILAVLGFGVWWFSQSNDQAPIEENKIEAPTSQPNKTKDTKTDLENKTPIEKKELEETKTPLEETKSPPKKSSKPPVYADDNQPKSNLIAAADLTPNPALELLINNNLRSNEVTIEIVQKQKNSKIETTGSATNFKLVGTFLSEDNLLLRNLKLNIFSNKKEDYENFHPTLSEKIGLKKLSNFNYEFDFQKAIVLKPGLYYYLIEDADTEEIFFIEKFNVNI